ncbi:hypothetical protein GHT06_008872 [Daphnia sinensis]|uniref:Uncharacterized protein n=1 Tax=Daphnia sinensis TaxID=1820382 RepID=A0AAD5L4I9_9CRUS|nr:hypothetical protein GHT06_008872 [Daphnia sinensis]
MGEFTYSTIVTTLASKLPADLQREWGRYAYNLQPRIASLADFDKWIDATVGAEELRGVTVNTVPTKIQQSYPPRAKPQYGPTILNLSSNAAGPAQANRASNWAPCAACKENPGHRLESCNVFRKILPNQRAALCA